MPMITQCPWPHNAHDYTMLMIIQCPWLHNADDHTMQIQGGPAIGAQPVRLTCTSHRPVIFQIKRSRRCCTALLPIKTARSNTPCGWVHPHPHAVPEGRAHGNKRHSPSPEEAVELPRGGLHRWRRARLGQQADGGRRSRPCWHAPTPTCAPHQTAVTQVTC